MRNVWMGRAGLIVTLCVCAMGCESDEQKLLGLHDAVAVAQAEVGRIEQAIDSVTGIATLRAIRQQQEDDLDAIEGRGRSMSNRAWDSLSAVLAVHSAERQRLGDSIRAMRETPEFLAAQDSLVRELEQAEIRLQLAQREVDRFLR